jgi:hypothetical protein
MSKNVSEANQDFINEFKTQKTDTELAKMAADLGFTDTKDEAGNVTESAAEKMAKSFGYEATTNADGTTTSAIANM